MRAFVHPFRNYGPCRFRAFGTARVYPVFPVLSRFDCRLARRIENVRGLGIGNFERVFAKRSQGMEKRSFHGPSKTSCRLRSIALGRGFREKMRHRLARRAQVGVPASFVRNSRNLGRNSSRRRIRYRLRGRRFVRRSRYDGIENRRKPLFYGRSPRRRRRDRGVQSPGLLVYWSGRGKIPCGEIPYRKELLGARQAKKSNFLFNSVNTGILNRNFNFIKAEK